MFDGRWRAGVDRGTEPLGAALGQKGITADELTVTGLVMALACALAIGSGHLKIGVAFLVASGLPDLLDGPVAKASGMSSARGAFFDSVADRVTDSLILGGVAWHLAGTQQSKEVLLLPFAILGMTFLVSYERAKAESLGLEARGGLMERAERMIMLGAGLFFSSVLIPFLWAILVLTLLTAIQRFATVWLQATPSASATARARAAIPRTTSGPPSEGWRVEEPHVRSGRPRRSGTSVGRWRARRQMTLSSRASRAVRAGRQRAGRAPGAAGRGGRPGWSGGRLRMGEALRRRVDGGQ